MDINIRMIQVDFALKSIHLFINTVNKAFKNFAILCVQVFQ